MTQKDCCSTKEVRLTRPELGFIVITRAMLATGIALFLADRLNPDRRKSAGITLAIVGILTTIPTLWAVFGKSADSGREEPSD